MKNLFDYATKELSQDAFLRWLFENYDCENKEVVETCKKVFNEFTNNDPDLDFSKIEELTTTAQWNKIDISIWFKYDGKEYLIVVEDKTISEEHEQLDNYNEKIKAHCNWLINIGKPIQKVYKVFYKTSKISNEEKDRIIRTGWNIILDITNIYNIFKEIKKTNSEVLDYYIEHIKSLNKLFNNFMDISIKEWCRNFLIFTNYSDNMIKKFSESISANHYRSNVYQGKYAETFIQKNLPNNITVELGLFFREWGCSAWIKVWNTNLNWKMQCLQKEEIVKICCIPSALKWEDKVLKNRIKIIKKAFSDNTTYIEFNDWIDKCLKDYNKFIDKIKLIQNLG